MRDQTDYTMKVEINNAPKSISNLGILKHLKCKFDLLPFMCYKNLVFYHEPAHVTGVASGTKGQK